jgi:amphi-Trp domain-containing protein
MSDKNKDKAKKHGVEFESSFSMAEAGRTLIELGQRVEGGQFSVSNGQRTLDFRIGGRVHLALRAKRAGQSQSLRVELSWDEASPAVNPKLVFGDIQDGDPAPAQSASGASAKPPADETKTPRRKRSTSRADSHSSARNSSRAKRNTKKTSTAAR